MKALQELNKIRIQFTVSLSCSNDRHELAAFVGIAFGCVYASLMSTKCGLRDCCDVSFLPY